ncbi:MAG: hypothetical protein CMF88_04235 [Candidatus Marinimicrobia bacterium]|nr:hypothetical protein [Candidatus Neomarinimicrobiota bacterium]
MRCLLLALFLFSNSFAQSLYANITIYKDGFALVKQPVLWEDLETDQSIIIWDILPFGIIYDSPFLVLENAKVLTQSFNQDVFHFSDRLYNYLGERIDVKLINENDMSGTLVEVTDETLTLQRRRSIISFSRDRVAYINLPGLMEDVQYKPTIKWTIETKEEVDTLAGNLTYLTSGFGWEANYRLIIEPNGVEGQFLADAKILNNTNMSFDKMNLSLVEGRINLNSKVDQHLQTAGGKSTVINAEVSELGDYHIYSMGTNMNLVSKETLVTRLYTPRQINFEKTYLFENNEKSQKEEPLSIEYKIPNTIENNLDLPLPKGKIQLYQVLNSGNIEYIGQDKISQVPRSNTATISSGKAFDVIGKRKVLNYDKQRKSEEASISITVTNTLNRGVNIKLIEHIYGDWVVRNASSNYRKIDASTIHFPLSIPQESSKTVTYTYRKEWK